MSTIPSFQKGFTYKSDRTNLVLKELPVPKPGPGEILIKVAASGVCHSDLHIIDGTLPFPGELVLGHEIAGTVVKLGEGVDPKQYPEGDLFAAVGVNPCGSCQVCRSGKDNLCTSTTRNYFGIGAPGGYEQYLIASPRNLIKVPDGVSPEIAAVTTDAVLTPYHALKKAGVNGLSRVLIIGLGGLGINAVQIAKAFGAHVTAYDLKESSRQLAKSLGADEVLENLTAESECGEYDVVADIVGIQTTFSIAVNQVKSGGVVMPIGLGSPTLSFPTSPVCFKEIRILGSFWGTSLDLLEVFELVSQGKIKAQIETGKFKDLDSILKKLQNGEIKSRLVLTDFDDVD